MRSIKLVSFLGFIVALVIMLICASHLNEVTVEMRSAGLEYPDLRMFDGKEKVQLLFSQIHAQPQIEAAYRGALSSWDLLYPISYVFVFSLILMWGWGPDAPTRLALLPFSVGIVDVIENLMGLLVLEQTGLEHSIHQGVWGFLIANWVKWGLTFLTIGLSIAGLIRRLLWRQSRV